MSPRVASPANLIVAGPRGPIAYERWGDAGLPPLLLLAGLGSRARLWGELPRLLSEKFTVLAPDNRGVGGSRAGSSFTVEGAADDAAEVVAHAGYRSTSVLGVSMGGLIACVTAIRHGNAVERLVAVSCAVRSTPSQLRVMRFFELVMTRMRPEEAGEALMAFAFSASFADRFPGFVDQAARLWTLDEEDLPGALAQMQALRAGWDVSDGLAGVSCPALAVAGELDPLVPAWATREVAAAIPGARYREVAGAAHSVLAEGGAPLLTEVLDFLQT